MLVRQFSIDQQQDPRPDQYARTRNGAGAPLTGTEFASGLQSGNDQRERAGRQHHAGAETQHGVVGALRRLPRQHDRQRA